MGVQRRIAAGARGPGFGLTRCDPGPARHAGFTAMAYLAQVEWVFSEVGSMRHLLDEDSGCWVRIWPINRSPHRCEGPHSHLVRNSRAGSVRLCATRGSYLAKVIPRLSFSTKKDR
jgi:hypothetical protein